MSLALRITVLCLGLLTLATAARAEPGDIAFVECLAADVNLTGVTGCTDVTPTTNVMRGFDSVVVSSDGLHVYGASSFANAVVHFSRDPADGRLTFADCVSSAVAITGCTNIGGTSDALNGASSLRLSPDGEDVYVVSSIADSVSQLSLAPDGPGAGALSFVDCWSTRPAAGCTDLSGVTESLNTTGSLEISPDGADVYTTSDSNPGAVTHFSRGMDGGLTFESCVSSGAVPGCTDLGPTTNAIQLVSPVVISPDGADIYVGADTRSAIIHFRRNLADGSFAFDSCLTSSTSTTGCAELATSAARRIVEEGLTISADGRHVYSASLAQAAVVQYNRAADTGALTQVDCITTAGATTNCRQIPDVEFQSLVNLTIANDGASVYASGLAANAVFGLDRDRRTGTLSFNDCISSTGAEPCIDLSMTAANSTAEPTGIAVSPRGESLYIGSTTAFLHADREPPVDLFSDSFEDF